MHTRGRQRQPSRVRGALRLGTPNTHKEPGLRVAELASAQRPPVNNLRIQSSHSLTTVAHRRVSERSSGTSDGHCHRKNHAKSELGLLQPRQIPMHRAEEILAANTLRGELHQETQCSHWAV